MMKIIVLVGSLSANSLNRRLARALEKRTASSFRFEYADLGGLPHFNEDLWSSPPEPVTSFKTQIQNADAVLFVTPEHFRAPTALILNAVAWGGRPWGKNSWADKPAAIVGTSPGSIGTAVAQSQLRSILPGLELMLLGQPEVYLQSRPGLINDSFEITDTATAEFLDDWARRFEVFVGKVNAMHAASSS